MVQIPLAPGVDEIARFIEDKGGLRVIWPVRAAMMAAALRKLELVDRKDHITLTVAKLIIGLAKQGERDPKKLCDRAVKILRK
jgi:hypothetical protein